MLDKERYTIRKMQEADLEQILEWRNSLRIRNSSINDQKISLKQHQDWFKKVHNSESCCYFVFEFDHIPSGLVYFTDIHRLHGRCNWGFYMGSLDLPKGSGTVMGYLALEYMFLEEGLHKICGEVLVGNQSSIKFHERLGFVKEGILHEQVFRSGSYWDIILYANFHNNWKNIRDAIHSELF